MNDGLIDLLVVGGGINGAGVARDAAGRGLSVMLVEKDDLAAHTSSASSKLIHGGLRYLEQLDLRLVRESLAERELLLRAAPHIVHPLQFLIPLGEASRPAWMIRAGLFLYDHLAGRKVLPRSRKVTLDDGTGAFSYWDCRVDDSRLVVLNVIDADERGATIQTRTELVEARREGDRWEALLRGSEGERAVRARAIVNAAGPWTAELFDRMDGVRRHRNVRLIKGSHIVLPRLYSGAHAFLLQDPGGRVVFAIPFERDFTLVGTTDVEWAGPAASPTISEQELDYLLEIVCRNFPAEVSSDDVVWSYSGIRALYDDGASSPSQVTRDYVLELEGSETRPPLLSVFGGKITTYRRLAERALGVLAPFFGEMRPSWTEQAVLPGGDISDRSSSSLAARYEWLPPDLLARLAMTYGTRTERLLQGAQTVTDLGEHFGSGLHAREVDYLVSEEWARTAEDILFRRTKLGLRMPTEGAKRLGAYLDEEATGARR